MRLLSRTTKVQYDVSEYLRITGKFKSTVCHFKIFTQEKAFVSFMFNALAYLPLRPVDFQKQHAFFNVAYIVLL